MGDSLSEIICTDKELDKFWIEQYLLILLQLKQYLKAVPVASDILSCDPKNIHSLEAICLAFVEEENIDISLDKAEEIIEALLSVNSKNDHGVLAKARWLLLKEKSLEAKQLLELLNTKEATRKSQFFLCDAYQQLHQWAKMENICRVGLESALSTESDKLCWRLRLIKSLIELDGDDRLNEASVILENVREEAKSTATFTLLETMYLLRTNQLEKCKNNLEMLEKQPPATNVERVLLIKAEYLEKIGMKVEAVQQLDRACENHPQNIDLLLNAAKMLWNRCDQREKSVAIMLNVIKINRDIAEPYILLGTFYSEQRHNLSSIQRAVRCLEKAFQLDPYQTRTSEKLLELYRLIDDITSALKLLEVVVRSNAKNRRWAWLQKGLLHLKKFQKEKQVPEKEKEAGLAITCLQNALAMDSNDSSGWEALGM